MIYLDNNATTFTDHSVIKAMMEIFAAEIGNPSSIHAHGQKAKQYLLEATRDVAAFFGVRPQEVIFTSGATEAINMLLHTLTPNGHLITSSLEHPALISAAQHMEAKGCEVTYLNPEPLKGSISSRQVENALRPNTSMIALMSVNNETGSRTDIEAIAALAQEVNVPLIVDGVAMLGKEKWHSYPGISAACFSGHKIHAPAGIGILIAKKQFKIPPFIVGGAQQNGKRGGTENLAGIVGFAKALSLIKPEDAMHMERLRNKLEKGLLDHLGDLIIHGIDQLRICNTSNISFLGIDGETLLMALDLSGVSVSHGSACSSGTLEAPRVLLNMGVAPQIARASIRFSLSRKTTDGEIEQAIEIVINTVRRLRKVTQLTA